MLTTTNDDDDVDHDDDNIDHDDDIDVYHDDDIDVYHDDDNIHPDDDDDFYHDDDQNIICLPFDYILGRCMARLSRSFIDEATLFIFVRQTSDLLQERIAEESLYL